MQSKVAYISVLAGLFFSLVISPGCSSSKGLNQTGDDNSLLKPNIIFILADDLGWSDLGVYGSNFHETPNLDNLAEQGMRFTQAYAAGPVCSPTRASIMTGKYPATLGITEHFHPPREPEPWHTLTTPYRKRQYLPQEEISIPEWLDSLEYVSLHVGKWHLGGEGHLPTDQGFDVNIAGSHRGLPQSYFYPFTRNSEEDLFGNPVDSIQTGAYLTDILTEKAIELMDEQGQQPFFLHLSFHNPHVPIMGKPDLVEKYKNKLAGMAHPTHANPHYAAMIETLDQNVGRLLTYLDESGRTRNTLVIFLSDNGGLSTRSIPGLDQHTPATTNAPLRAGKGSLYEGGIRVPMIARWPGQIPSGQVSDELVITNDLFPTIAGLFGKEVPFTEGVSLLPVLTGKEELQRNTLCWHFPHYRRQPEDMRPAGAIREGDYKLIEYFEDGAPELYNLAEDIGETRNLADEQPEKAQALQQKLERWREQVNAQMPKKNPN